jgi:hypothetical protein
LPGERRAGARAELHPARLALAVVAVVVTTAAAAVGMTITTMVVAVAVAVRRTQLARTPRTPLALALRRVGQPMVTMRLVSGRAAQGQRLPLELERQAATADW